MSVKTAGVGHFAIPTAPAAGTSCTSGAANTFTTTYVQLIASTAAPLYITGVHVESAAALAATYITVQLASGGAGSETVIGQYLVPLVTGSTVALGFRPIFPPIPVGNATRIACKTADSVGAKATLITLECIAQSNVVDDGIAVGTVTTVTNQLTAAQVAAGVWGDTVAGDFTVAASVGKSVMNGVALGTGLTINSYTGNTAQTGDSFAVVKSGGTGDNVAIKAKTDNLPASPASTTNITAGTIANVTNDVGITQAGADKVWSTAARALTDKAGFALSSAGVQAIWDKLTSALTTVGSVGKLLVDNIDAAISSRSTYAGGAVASVTGAVGSVTGLTAADVGAIKAKTDNLPAAPASTTNITAGVITTVTTVTNDVGITQTGADKVWGTAVRALTDKAGFALSSAGVQAIWDALVSALTTVGSVGKLLVDKLDATISSRSTYAGGAVASVTGNVAGSVASVVGLDPSKIDAAISTRLPTSSYTAPDNTGIATAAAAAPNLDVAVSTRLAAAGYTAPNNAGIATAAAAAVNLDVAVSTRLAAAGYTAPDNAGIAAVQAKTDSLTFTVADELDVNVHSIAGTGIVGDGSLVPWGPTGG